MALRLEELEGGKELTIDSTATRSMVRSAYPTPGLFNKFYDQNLRPVLEVMQDTCARRDAFGMACTARGYEDRGFPGHLNCSDNISAVLDPHGVTDRTAWAAINFFWNTWIDPNTHQLLTEESHSRPGDYVVMKALDPLVCVTSACPDDLDPINGWNPTDVHVRIYRPDAPIQRAVAYREKESAPMSISNESAFHPATSKLTTHFAAARDLWTPVSYQSVGTIGEYWACRERVALQDMSSLRNYDIVGPDAERLLQRALTRDLARLAVWRGTYALMCDQAGSVIDDGTLFRLGPDLFRWCCGSEESGRVLDTLASEEGLQARIHGMDGAMPNLALQGPKSRDVLRKITFTLPSHAALDNLKWFGVTIARLRNREGIPFMLSRTGYTGELGYELFCAASDAPALWDAVMEAGEEFGIAPMGSAALETIRIEAGLASVAEFAPRVDAHEAGLGFAISRDKADFVGKAALERNARDPRRLLKGLKLDSNDAPLPGAHVYSGERQVGVVTSATYMADKVNSVEDLRDPEIAAMFGTDGNGKGKYWAGDVTWASTKRWQIKFKSYGLDGLWEPNIVSADTFKAGLEAAYTAEKPQLFYYGTPEAIHVKYDLTAVEEPARTDGCEDVNLDAEDWLEVSEFNCVIALNDIYVAYSASLEERNPAVAKMLSNVQFIGNEINAWIVEMFENKRDPREVAEDWIADNKELVQGWING